MAPKKKTEPPKSRPTTAASYATPPSASSPSSPPPPPLPSTALSQLASLSHSPARQVSTPERWYKAKLEFGQQEDEEDSSSLAIVKYSPSQEKTPQLLQPYSQVVASQSPAARPSSSKARTIEKISQELASIAPSASTASYASPSSPQVSTNFKPAKSFYIRKPNPTIIFPLEIELTGNDPLTIIKRLWPNGWTFAPTDFSRTQKFYEFILVDTGSVLITHTYDQQDPSLLTHSKCVIQRVLTLTDWGSNPSKPRDFSQNFKPRNFNYFDYKQAWSHCFFYQNKINAHSWFFLFNKKSPIKTFPYWFSHWWSVFGPIQQIFPPIANEGFVTFTKLFNPPEKDRQLPTLLLFFSKFSLAWITSWRFALAPPENQFAPPSLVRSFAVKWWADFNIGHISPDSINKWFINHPELCKSSSPQSSQFALAKAQFQARLAQASSPEAAMEIIQEFRDQFSSPSQSEEEAPTIKEEEEDSDEDSSSHAEYSL